MSIITAISNKIADFQEHRAQRKYGISADSFELAKTLVHTRVVGGSHLGTFSVREVEEAFKHLPARSAIARYVADRAFAFKEDRQKIKDASIAIRKAEKKILEITDSYTAVTKKTIATLEKQEAIIRNRKAEVEALLADNAPWLHDASVTRSFLKTYSDAQSAVKGSELVRSAGVGLSYPGRGDELRQVKAHVETTVLEYRKVVAEFNAVDKALTASRSTNPLTVDNLNEFFDRQRILTKEWHRLNNLKDELLKDLNEINRQHGDLTVANFSPRKTSIGE